MRAGLTVNSSAFSSWRRRAEPALIGALLGHTQPSTTAR